jgi:ESCRT-I complex subunit VPS28
MNTYHLLPQHQHSSNMYGPQVGSRPPSYAPVYNSLPNSSLHATINLDEEVKLADSVAERDLIDSLAEIYSIIRTLDGLVKAYNKDAVPEAEYRDMCSKMLRQYKSIISDETVLREFVDEDTFVAKWNIECPGAIKILKLGIPGTEVHAPNASTQQGPGNGSNAPSGAQILTATENFITFLDALRLNMLSKSALHPLLSDVIQSVNKVTDQDFEHRGKIIQWLITLNQMRTADELSEDQARDLAFDMEQAYNGFKSIIT